MNNNLKKIGCDYFKNIKNFRLATGAGGSRNIVLIINESIVYKIIPRFVETREYDDDKTEIKFYKFLTSHVVSKNKSPHFVCLYDNNECNNIDALLNKLYKCPNKNDILVQKVEDKYMQICIMKLQFDDNLLNKNYDVLTLEYIPIELSEYFIQHMNLFKSKTKINLLCDIIDRLVFQLLYSICGLQKIYKFFIHNDLFMRNVLCYDYNEYNINDYMQYQIYNKKYFLPANGIFIKINDFGRSVLINKIKSSTVSKFTAKYRYIDINDRKSDIYNFLRDIYDGQNLDGVSLMSICKELKITDHNISLIKKTLDKYIKTDIIDKINNANKSYVNDIWNITGLKTLEKTVLDPKEYFKKGIFKKYTLLPKNANIIKKYSFD